MTQRIGYVCTESWAGTAFWRVRVVHETPKRYKVRTLSKAMLPRGWVERGTELFVPKYAVTFQQPPVRCGRAVLL